MPLSQPDLTQQPPRSPRVRLGGYVILPRLLDKGRAASAGKNGDYKYACPLDQRFLEYTRVDAEALRQQLAAGKGDGEILDWINAHAQHPRHAAEIALWSAGQEQRAPGDTDSRDFFQKLHRQAAPLREDIFTWFDLLDLDDYASFGGKP